LTETLWDSAFFGGSSRYPLGGFRPRRHRMDAATPTTWLDRTTAETRQFVGNSPDPDKHKAVRWRWVDPWQMISIRLFVRVHEGSQVNDRANIAWPRCNQRRVARKYISRPGRPLRKLPQPGEECASGDRRRSTSRFGFRMRPGSVNRVRSQTSRRRCHHFESPAALRSGTELTGTKPNGGRLGEFARQHASRLVRDIRVAIVNACQEAWNFLIRSI
jgi:hypothetical protein